MTGGRSALLERGGWWDPDRNGGPRPEGTRRGRSRRPTGTRRTSVRTLDTPVLAPIHTGATGPSSHSLGLLLPDLKVWPPSPVTRVDPRPYAQRLNSLPPSTPHSPTSPRACEPFEVRVQEVDVQDPPLTVKQVGRDDDHVLHPPPPDRSLLVSVVLPFRTHVPRRRRERHPPPLLSSLLLGVTTDGVPDRSLPLYIWG